MARYSVLVTDYAWPNLDLERAILQSVDADIVLPDSTDVGALKAIAPHVDAIMTNWVKVPAEVINAAEKCRIVSRLGIGLDNIDVDACTARRIPVTNVPDYCIHEVAEHTLALLLGLARKIGWYHHATKSGIYQLQSGPDMFRIRGRTLGLIGFGNIGQLTAEAATALGLKVLIHSRTVKPSPSGTAWVDLTTLLRESDFVSLHVPATPETRHLLNAERLALLKPTAYIINTSRGALIDHTALCEAIKAGRLAGAALDVQEIEPPDLRLSPYNDPRVIITPHAAFVSAESLTNLRTRAARQVADRLIGKLPDNVRNPEVL